MLRGVHSTQRVGQLGEAVAAAQQGVLHVGVLEQVQILQQLLDGGEPALEHLLLEVEVAEGRAEQLGAAVVSPGDA